MISPKDVSSVDGHVLTELPDHGPELVVASKVAVPPMKSNKVLALKDRPHCFLAVGGGRISGLKAHMKAAELVADMRTMMSAVIVENQVGTCPPVGIS